MRAERLSETDVDDGDGDPGEEGGDAGDVEEPGEGNAIAPYCGEECEAGDCQDDSAMGRMTQPESVSLRCDS